MDVNANLIENALYDAYGPRWVSTIYGSINEYKVLLELEPKYQADPRALSLLYFKNIRRQADSAGHAGQARDRDRPADHQPLRPASRGHDLVQPEARRRAGRGGRPDPGAGRQDAAGHHQHAVPGRGQGVSEFAGQPVGAADHRHHGGVHRAGHSVRELHPPDHDSLRACRRPASARCSRWSSSTST